MSVILGLDVSTSIVGVSVVNSCVEPDDLGSHILLLDRVEFKKCKTLFEKADLVQSYLTFFKGCDFPNIDRVVLEEPLMGFRPGMSSAQTISTLMRFNGICSYIARNTFEKEPEYIGSSHARKLCGVRLQRTALGGPQKEQVFFYFKEHDLKHVVWPLKKSGKQEEWSRDATDAYCIARAAAIEGVAVPQTKKKKRAKTATKTI